MEQQPTAPSRRPSRRERPAKAALSREGIVAVALAIMRAEGLAKITMRRIAAALDTGAASLYVYVRDTEDLHAQLLDALLADVVVPEAGDWRQRLKRPDPALYRPAVRLSRDGADGAVDPGQWAELSTAGRDAARSRCMKAGSRMGPRPWPSTCCCCTPPPTRPSTPTGSRRLAPPAIWPSSPPASRPPIPPNYRRHIRGVLGLFGIFCFLLFGRAGAAARLDARRHACRRAGNAQAAAAMRRLALR